jgi:hypothetical protein
MNKIPTSWQVPDGWVLTWYPPFVLPTAQEPQRLVFVYDDDEPFIPSGDGYNPNGRFDVLGDELVHPCAYALNIAGEEPAKPHPNAVQVRGR